MDLKELIEILDAHKDIYISGHVNPDGDCIGACCALAEILEKQGYNVYVALQDVPDTYNYLPGSKYLITEIPDKTDISVFIAMDCGDKQRLGAFEEAFDRSQITINIDHHVSNTKFAKYNYVADVSSTCEMVYEMINECDVINDNIARSIYTGIVYDTGVFKHSNTTSRTHQIAGELIKYKFDFTEIINKLYYYKSFTAFKVLGHAIENAVLFEQDKIALSSLTLEELKRLEASKKDTESIVQLLNEIVGCKCAIFIYEVSKGEFKVSLRSKGSVDVCKVAKKFNGGGHTKAAGCSIVGDLNEVKQLLIEELKRQL